MTYSEDLIKLHRYQIEALQAENLRLTSLLAVERAKLEVAEDLINENNFINQLNSEHNKLNLKYQNNGKSNFKR
tara:strand:- start:327 stop:548 length:222 start_codon:yes stop_codon:yes gene_type:complete